MPVHLVGSEETRAASSALKIQKVFRGFLVRKSLKKIVGIRSEIDEIERSILRCETVNMIRRDPKEQLKVNEVLMALLFRLDSVRGVDSGVRECRKAVIRKAIMLQDKVDAIVSGNLTVDAVDGEEAKDQAKTLEKLDVAELKGNSESKADKESSGSQNPCEEESLEKQSEQIQEIEKDPVDTKVVMEMNEKLMGLVMELYVRNAMQSRSIRSLSQRVENLERDFKKETLRRKENGHSDLFE